MKKDTLKTQSECKRCGLLLSTVQSTGKGCLTDGFALHDFGQPPPNADTTMTYPLLEKAPQPHTSWQFLDFICKNNEIVYENNEWVVIKNCKYNGAGKPLWLTAFHKGNLDSQAIMDLWSLWCGGDFEKWEWLIKARSKQTVKRFHIHLIQK
jgi:hypothetical protein